jgi:hypothetical protein
MTNQLLCILYDLGFPTDAIEVVKDLYTGAKTRIQTPYWPTAPIPIDRGTIQGDSISPFLFIGMMEQYRKYIKGYAAMAAPCILCCGMVWHLFGARMLLLLFQSSKNHCVKPLCWLCHSGICRLF